MVDLPFSSSMLDLLHLRLQPHHFTVSKYIYLSQHQDILNPLFHGCPPRVSMYICLLAYYKSMLLLYDVLNTARHPWLSPSAMEPSPEWGAQMPRAVDRREALFRRDAPRQDVAEMHSVLRASCDSRPQ